MSVVNLDPPIIRPKEPVLLAPPDTTILKRSDTFSTYRKQNTYFNDRMCTREKETSIYHNPLTIPGLISFVIRLQKEKILHPDWSDLIICTRTSYI